MTAPRWRVRRHIAHEDYPFVWWVDRRPIPEDDGLTGNDYRTCIDGGSFETWAEAMEAANAGAILDLQYGNQEATHP